MTRKEQTRLRGQRIWDFCCFFSLVGIWPRFIEPYRLEITKHKLQQAQLPDALSGLKIAQISDLHFHPLIKPGYLAQILEELQYFSPDLLFFTGDFLCESRLYEKERLLAWMKRLPSRYGIYAILGNHDYTSYVHVSGDGDYSASAGQASTWHAIFSLFRKTHFPRKAWKENLSTLIPHPELVSLIKEAGWVFLHNAKQTLSIHGIPLSIVGLGDYSSGHFDPMRAFAACDSETVTLILSHNPDSLPLLRDFPGKWVFSGHTHGAQVNLPGFRRRILRNEQASWYRGWVRDEGKEMYINRGLGGLLTFRVASRPEISLFTLEKKVP